MRVRGWKDLPMWLKGGIIASVIDVGSLCGLFSIYGYLYIMLPLMLLYRMGVAYKLGLVYNSIVIIPTNMGLIVSVIGWFFIGSLIGGISSIIRGIISKLRLKLNRQ